MEKKKKLVFTGKDKEHFDALMHAREQATQRIQYHVEDALDCSEADKRGVSSHMADVCSDNSRHEMELRMLSEEGDILQLIDDALERLEHGEYGLCQECGEPISEGRLKIRPYAIFCIKCKEKHEREMRR